MGKIGSGSDALIGYSGFVGQTLARQHSFSAFFNTANISQLDDQPFNLVVCAAAPGSMLEANNSPDVDKQKIHKLMDQLSKVVAKRFVLISSIAVLADFAGRDDEDTKSFQKALAYGRHRRELEEYCENNFSECLVVRLPALFGKGLRKNFIFDLLNPVPTMLTVEKFDALVAGVGASLREVVAELYKLDSGTGLTKLDRSVLDLHPMRSQLNDAVKALGLSATQFHNPETTYQYYNMNRLWADIGTATDFGLRHIHLVTEPLHAARIHLRLTGEEMPETGARLHREDVHTAHAARWGRDGPYLEDADRVLDQLDDFFKTECKIV